MKLLKIIRTLEQYSNAYKLIMDRGSRFMQLDTKNGNCVYTGNWHDMSEEELLYEIIPELQEEE